MSVVSTHAMGKMEIYLLLCCCLSVRLHIFQAGIKIVSYNFAQWFIPIRGRESPIMVYLGP